MTFNSYSVPKYDVEEFVTEAKKQLALIEDLSVQKILFQTTLPSLKEHFFNQPSQFTRWAKLYNDLDFFSKLFYNFTSIMFGACVGSVFNLTLPAAFFSFTIFTFCKYLLIDHYEKTEEKLTVLLKDIKHTEQALKDALSRTHELSKDVCEILTRVCNQNIQSAQLLRNYYDFQNTLKTGIEKITQFAAQLEIDYHQVTLESIPEKLKVLHDFNQGLFKALDKINSLSSKEDPCFFSNDTQVIIQQSETCFHKHEQLLLSLQKPIT
jgi:hypothetical protein